MKLTSSAFKNNELIPAKYTCDGENINPPLQIDEVPENTKSFVLICDDPDSPTGTWVHWTMWSIPTDTKEIIENNIPTGAIEGMTTFGKSEYGGPCPGSGEHRYFFKLYALDTTLELNRSADKKDAENAIQGHVLAQTELMGRYTRS